MTYYIQQTYRNLCFGGFFGSYEVCSCGCGFRGSLLVSLVVFSPAQILLIVQTTAIRHFYISLFWNLEICSYLFFSVFFFALYLIHPSILFYSSLCPLFCSLALCLFTLFSDLPFCFIFRSAVLSFLFSYYSILSASPFCLILSVLLLFNLFSFCYSSSF